MRKLVWGRPARTFPHISHSLRPTPTSTNHRTTLSHICDFITQYYSFTAIQNFSNTAGIIALLRTCNKTPPLPRPVQVRYPITPPYDTPAPLNALAGVQVRYPTTSLNNCTVLLSHALYDPPVIPPGIVVI